MINDYELSGKIKSGNRGARPSGDFLFSGLSPESS